MRVDGIIFADDTLIEQIKKDQGPEQVVNVATLPGIQKASLAMPDIHWGYGFCIGGVAATDPEEGGVISPGGVGYDINCGVRLLRTNLDWSEVKDRIKPLVDQLFRDIPTGVGQSGRYLFDKPKLTRLMAEGASYVVDQGYGTEHDLTGHRGRRLSGRGRPGPGQRPRDHARLRPVRHARLGQPFPRGPGRRPRSTTRPRPR